MRWSRLWVRCGFIGLSSLLSATPARAQVVNILHSFAGGSDGQNPNGSLTLVASTLFGMTQVGGSSGDGTIFQIGTGGTSYGIMQSFAGGANDGLLPSGSLTQVGPFLYGTTQGGGSAGNGTIFKIGINGNPFSLMHSFAGGPGDGSGPLGSLALSGSTLLGTTTSGGSVASSNMLYQNGTTFRIATDGTSYSATHSFAGPPGDGYGPEYGTPAVSGSTVFGTTVAGGTDNYGAIYKMAVDGTSYQVLHSFQFGVGSGGGPFGSLILDGSTLYGMASAGGIGNHGTVFKMAIDGSGYTTLHAFAGGLNDGAAPEGGLVLAGSTLYGMTTSGGAAGLGVLFGIGEDGSGYDVMHSFLGGALDGARPAGDLLLDGGTLYGLSDGGGVNNLGTVFSFTPIPEPSSLLLISASTPTLLVYISRRGGTRRIRRIGPDAPGPSPLFVKSS
jgi:uncharacterized repeat protein (TIGR03803 family)